MRAVSARVTPPAKIGSASTGRNVIRAAASQTELLHKRKTCAISRLGAVCHSKRVSHQMDLGLAEADKHQAGWALPKRCLALDECFKRGWNLTGGLLKLN